MAEPAYIELTDEELRVAVEHARGNAAQTPTSPEYRQWWTARADTLQAALDEREGAPMPTIPDNRAMARPDLKTAGFVDTQADMADPAIRLAGLRNLLGGLEDPSSGITEADAFDACREVLEAYTGEGVILVEWDGGFAVADSLADAFFKAKGHYLGSGEFTVRLNYQPEERLAKGDRITLTREVERFPHFTVEADATGTVTEATRDLVTAKMDEFIAGCEEWENEIVWTRDDDADALMPDARRAALLDLSAFTPEG